MKDDELPCFSKELVACVCQPASFLFLIIKKALWEARPENIHIINASQCGSHLWTRDCAGSGRSLTTLVSVHSQEERSRFQLYLVFCLIALVPS
jgi:hypothetical protein